jgi:hypothetical protein
VTADPAGGTFAEKLDAAAGPLRRMGAITAQIALATIPADASCHCLCSIYEPHTCDGWRADGCFREVPSARFLGMQPAPTVVPLCRSCDGVGLRQG